MESYSRSVKTFFNFILSLWKLIIPLMYAAFVQVLGGKLWGESGLQSSEKKKWTRRLEHFTLQDENTLMFNNRKVPTTSYGNN